MTVRTIIFLLLLSSCGAGSMTAKYDYYEKGIQLQSLAEARKYYNEEVRKNWIDYKEGRLTLPIQDIEGTIEKKYCVYNTLYFIYFNFWDLRFSHEEYLNRYLKDAKTLKAKDIKISDTWFTIGIIGFVCTEIKAVPIYE